MSRKASVLAAALLIGLAAAPEQRPLATPARDVDVVYRTVPGGGTPELQQRVRWDVAGGRQRVDPPMAGIYLILDYRAHHLSSIRDSIKAVLEIDGDRAQLMPVAGAQHYTRVGDARVNDLPCGLWRLDDGVTPERRLCVTDDGVLLQLSAGGTVLIEAISVRYGPADPAAFVVPEGYQHIAPTAAPAAGEKAP
jgi:hypothetical protein